MSFVEKLEAIGFSDKQRRIEIMPQINDTHTAKGKESGRVLRNGEQKDIGVYRSLLFRKPGTDVVVDTQQQCIWNNERLKSGTPTRFVGSGFVMPGDLLPGETFGTAAERMTLEIIQGLVDQSSLQTQP